MGGILGYPNITQITKFHMGSKLEEGENSVDDGSVDVIDTLGSNRELTQRARMFIVKQDAGAEFYGTVKGWKESPSAWTDAADFELNLADLADWNGENNYMTIVELPALEARYWGFENSGDSATFAIWFVERYDPKTQAETPPNTPTDSGQVYWTRIPRPE